MNHKVIVAGLLALCGTSFGAALEVGVDVATRTDEASFATLQTALGTPLTGIDLSTQPYTGLAGGSTLSDGAGGADNVLTGAYSNLSYTGTLTSEVFANQGTVGPGVSDVVIRYTFTNNGGSVTPIDTFNFGINDGTVLDFGDLAAATHGRLADVSTPALATPFVSIDDSGNTTYDFNFGIVDALAQGETLTWYVAASGDVKVNVVDVTITNFQNATTQALAFTTTGGQDDLDVPAPGVAALAGLGVLGLRRRRR